jgi:GLPGLI family protein
LPGLILTLTVDSNRVVYTATAVDTTTPVAKIAAPSEGNKVTRAEYDKIVAEKQAEMAKSRRGRRN